MAKRRIIAGEGIPTHDQPFPTAVRVGNMIFSSAVGGRDEATGATPRDKAAQVAQAFANMRRIVEEGGGSVDGIAKVAVYLSDRNDRNLVNAEWIRMFPDGNNRPVRHTMALPMTGHRMIQLEFIAVI